MVVVVVVVVMLRVWAVYLSSILQDGGFVVKSVIYIPTHLFAGR